MKKKHFTVQKFYFSIHVTKRLNLGAIGQNKDYHIAVNIEKYVK